MKAVYYEQFKQRPELRQLPDPTPSKHGVVIEVKATGLCRSDWHGWCGHDADITLPHVPGHELAGVVKAVGSDVQRWRGGERVTLPFVGGCGHCPECDTGNHQVCSHQFQPGFTHWGSFAEYVAIDYADTNLVALPEHIDFATAASLGCRFATAFRAVASQGRVSAGQWVVVHGCGGVGLSALMIAAALGAQCIAVDVSAAQLQRAKALGAVHCINARDTDVVEAIRELTQGGALVSIDALGSAATCFNSIACLGIQGRHVQVGLLAGADFQPALPMELVIAKELHIVGSHGLQAHAYAPMLQMITHGKLHPQQLIGRHIALADSIDALIQMDSQEQHGMTIIDRF
jgi:alcohol dehydrogenase